MFKRANSVFVPSLLSSDAGKLKQKILKISALSLFVSSLLTDVINARTGSNLNWLLLFIKNIYLIVPWALIYLLAKRERDLLKTFTPIYLSIVLLVLTGSLTFHHFVETKHLQHKLGKEMANIVKDTINFMSGEESQISQTSTYSVDEYGRFSPYLNKFKQYMELCKQEGRAMEQAVDEVDVTSIFTEEVLFDFLNILIKKKKFEQVSIFLDESEARTESNYAEFVTWVLSSSGVDEASCIEFLETDSEEAKEKEFFRKEPYRITKNMVREFIELLDFLSKRYGTYEKGINSLIDFAYTDDLLAWKLHCAAIANLAKEGEKFELLFQDRLSQIEKKLNPNEKRK